MPNNETDFPVWDEYAHVFIMGMNDKMEGNVSSEFEDIKLQRIYNLGRGLGLPKTNYGQK